MVSSESLMCLKKTEIKKTGKCYRHFPVKLIKIPSLKYLLTQISKI